MALGKQIKKYRLAHGWTLEELSDRCDVEVGTISALEVRDSKRSEKAPAIAKALGLSLEMLLDESTDWSETARAQLISDRMTYGRMVPAPEHQPAAHHKAAENVSHSLHVAFWPFSVGQERFRRLLSKEDIDSIDNFIKGIVAAREVDARKSGNGS